MNPSGSRATRPWMKLPELPLPAEPAWLAEAVTTLEKIKRSGHAASVSKAVPDILGRDAETYMSGCSLSPRDATSPWQPLPAG